MFISTIDEREQMKPLNNQIVHYCPPGFEDYKLGDVGGDGCTLCTELKLLELLKEDLIRRTAQLRVKINQTHSAINCQLPPEILATIFQAYVEDPSYDDPLYEVDPSQYPPRNCVPFLLGAVCRTWRDIAWSTPRLWASITINLDFPPPKRAAQMSLIQEWLSRAGQLPLSIRLVNDTSRHNDTFLRNDDIPQMRSLIDLVNQYSPRWRNLIINLPTYMLPWFATVGDHAPLLAYLKVEGKHHFRNNGWSFETGVDTLTLGKTPSLKYLSIQRLSLCQLNLDWGALTHFSSENLTDVEGLEVLRRAPLLQHVSQTTAGFNASPDLLYAAPSAPIVAQHLRTLALTFQKEDGAAFMAGVTCPALHTLAVTAPPMGALAAFARRSGFALRSLSLKFCREQAGSFVQLLREQPALEELSVGWSPHLGVLLAALTAGAKEGVLLPKLERLEYMGAPVDLDWAQFGALFSALPTVPSAEEDEGWASAATATAPEARYSRPWRHIAMTLLQDGDHRSTDARGVPYIPETILAGLHSALKSGIEVEVKVPAYSHSDTGEVMGDWVGVSEQWHAVQRERAAEMGVGAG